MAKTSILFVCLGNICRSPVAEGVFRQKAQDAGLLDDLTIDSAGTAGWHVGKSPDGRMISAARERGYDLTPLRARQVIAGDFNEYDLILAMDDDNLAQLIRLNPGQAQADVSLYLNYAAGSSEREVPDPYYGGEDGFHHVIDLVEAAADGLLSDLKDAGKT